MLLPAVSPFSLARYAVREDLSSQYLYGLQARD